MSRNTFLLRAASVVASNVDDSSAPPESYSEKLVRLNRERLKVDPGCAESQRKSRKWAVKLERQRKGR